MPKRHVKSLDELDDPMLAGELLMTARKVAHDSHVKASWRLLVNVGEKGGQVVYHLHLHVLGRNDGLPLD
ncbi:MAG TPA: HIT domain-containing protein [Candidatus Saccharimonadia bacterium]